LSRELFAEKSIVYKSGLHSRKYKTIRLRSEK